MKKQETKVDGILLDVSISPDIEKGRYANMTVIEPSENEVFLNFLFLQPTVNNTKKGEVQARIVMTPLSIKKMAIKVITWLQNYEKENGKIVMKFEDDSVFDQKTVIDG